MKNELMSLSCDPMCGFMIRSHDEKEIIDISKVHAKSKHKMNMTTEEVKKMIKKA